MLEWTYSGVNFSLPGYGGEECAAYIPRNQQIVETAVMLVICTIEIVYACKKIDLPCTIPRSNKYDSSMRRVLLLLHAGVFGIELGYKLATEQMIFVLYPCHVITVLQLYLLAAPPTKLTLVLFRIQMHCLSGSILALVLPATSGRDLPFQLEVYYIQHILMLIVPYYMMRVGGPYTLEASTDHSWLILGIGAIHLHHFLPMQYVSVMTNINIGYMLCPAESDPFASRWYRIAAVIHQHTFIPLHNKLYFYILTCLLPKQPAATSQVPQQRIAGAHSNGLKQD